MRGLTLDTGALIALERGKRRVAALLFQAQELRQVITVPSPVVLEWWRGQRGPATHLLRAFDIEELSEVRARRAGEALAAVSAKSKKPANKGGPSVVDAVVMSSAAQRGDVVLTSDLDDLSRWAAYYPQVRLLGI